MTGPEDETGAGRRGHVRAAHADPGPADAARSARAHQAFNRVAVRAPWIEVDTTDGYRPGLSEIVAFASHGTPPG